VADSMMALHASAVITPGGVLLFLGHGGTGKSTVCGLLARNYSALADDAVFLSSRGNGDWLVADGSRSAFGLPGVEEEERARTSGVALLAVFRLRQESQPRVVPIDPVDTCRHLTDALFEIKRQQRGDLAAKRARFADLADIARRYPGAELHFSLDVEETCRVVEEYLEDQEVLEMKSPV
jgi:hypothetical protein